MRNFFSNFFKTLHFRQLNYLKQSKNREERRIVAMSRSVSLDGEEKAWNQAHRPGHRKNASFLSIFALFQFSVCLKCRFFKKFRIFLRIFLNLNWSKMVDRFYTGRAERNVTKCRNAIPIHELKSL